MAVKEAIDVLKNINCKHEDKEAAYANLISNLKNTTTEDELKTQGAQLLKLLYQDLLDTDEKIILSALQVVHFCLGSEHFESLQKSDSELALKSLLHCSLKTSSVDVIKFILDCFSVQRFDQDVLSTEISVFLRCMEELNSKVKAKSVFVVEKQVKIFVRLKEQIEKRLKQSAPRWARLVFPGLVNSSQDVREMALSLLEHFREDLCDSQDLSRRIIKALNSGLAESLKALMLTQESYVLKAWSLIVLVTGQGLHKGSTINLLLEIAEIGFKGSHAGRHNAFIAWRSLIDNFALDKARLLDAKRIKLLLMVLKIDNAKVEHVAIQKLHTWWHLCSCIGTKLAVNFEMIVHPLLQFCVGNGKLNNASDMGQSSKLVINASSGPHSSSSVINNMPVFPVVQKLSCEVIARLVSKIYISDDPGNVTWTIGALSDEVLGSPAIFVKHSPIIMTALQTVLLSVGKEIEENLVLHIWISLGNHLKVAMESSVKTECRDIFSSYLNILHSMTQNQVLQTQTILRMTEICCSFPQKVLASTAYNIAGGQPVRGCPALLLNEVLLTSYVIENTSDHENFIKLFSTLVNAGASNIQEALLYLQTVTEMMDLQALTVTSPELLWKMWSSLAHTLQDTINTTNKVNQGDALEYNFTCIYSVLLLPVKHHLSSKVSQAVSKTLLKTWKELYHSFARLSALVATAETNFCLEEMCAKILENWNTKPQDPVNLELMSNLCHKMIECVDFSAVSVNQNPVGGLILSPGKWVRRKRPMGNLHSFVHLLATLQTELNLILSTFEDSEIVKKQDFTRTVISIAHILVEVYIKLFTHITSSDVVSSCLKLLVIPLTILFTPDTKSGYGKLFVPFSTKLEKLWQEIAQCIIGHYNGLYDSEFLKHLSPLLEVTFEHKLRPIKNQSLKLWNTTFGLASALEYPSQLKQILIRIKMEKNTIIIPGLNTSNQASVVAETPFSEMSMGDSQFRVRVLPQLASPKHQKGSLLNKDLSPAIKLSSKPKVFPAKIVSPKEASSLLSGTRKRIADVLPIEKFLRIDSPATKKKKLLIDHQKEVLKQKCMSSADVIVVNSSESQGHTHETRYQGKVSKYRRQLESPKEPARYLVRSPQSQLSYKPTQESQLNSFGPVFPEFVDCSHPLDDILPQLTSSHEYRGLCQIMKGRNVNTIGDLSTLTEVQINQLPIRNPKVESVKSTLNNYMIQHGLVKVISCVEDMQDSNKSSRSKGSTIEQEITPSSIDDEGIQIQPEADKDLKQLSPIKEADAEPPKLSPLLLYMKEANNSSPATTEDETTGDATPRDERPLQMSSCLKDTVKQYSPSNLKKASLSELFDIQQTLNLLSTNLIEEMKSLNLLFKNVVEEMKSRHSST